MSALSLAESDEKAVIRSEQDRFNRKLQKKCFRVWDVTYEVRSVLTGWVAVVSTLTIVIPYFLE